MMKNKKYRRTESELKDAIYKEAASLQVYYIWHDYYGWTVETYYRTFFADTFRGLINMIRKEVKWHENYKKRH